MTNFALQGRRTSSVLGIGFLLALVSGCTADVGSDGADGATVESDGEALAGHHRAGFKVLGPEGKPLGKSYGGWSAEWWRWSYGSPGSTHPVLDETGEFCGVNQHEPVFFLAGSFGETLTRKCTVPRDKPVFFPILNLAYDNCGVPPEDQLTNAELKDYQEHYADTVASIEVDIDGKVLGSSSEELEPYLIDVTRFSYFVPAEDSIYDVFGSDFAGVCKPSFSAGYYMMLALQPGHHELHFSGSDVDGFALDTTYHLTVK